MSRRIVVFLIDRLPATSLGCFGSWLNPTPQLDALASRSLVCSNYFDFGASSSAIAANDCETICFTPTNLRDTVDEDLLAGTWTTWVGTRPEGMELDALGDLWSLYVSQPQVLADRPVAERLALHAAWVRAVDRWIGEQLSNLEPALEPNTLLLVTASQGESLAVRDLGLDRQRPLQPAIQHLPLIIAVPTQQSARRLLTPMGPADLHSLMQLLSESTLPPDELLNQWRTTLESRPAMRAATATHSVQMTSEWTCFQAQEQDDSSSEDVMLFHRPEDPWGLLNVASQYPHIVEQFQQET